MKGFFVSLSILVTIFFMACGGGQKDEVINLTDTTFTTAPTQAKAITVDTFKKAFNDYLSQMGSPYNIEAFKQKQVADTVSVIYRFNKNIFLIGKLKGTSNALSDVTLILSSGGNQNAGIEIIMMMSALVKATNPTLSLPEIEQKLTEIGFLNPEEDLLQLDKEIEVNQVKYHVVFAENVGFIFSAIM